MVIKMKNNVSVEKDQVLLEVKDLRKYFPIKKGFRRKVVGNVHAVDGLNFFIRKGETLSLVGESGCGKTTTARCLIRALKPTGGEINYQTENKGKINVANLPKSRLGFLRKQMQMIFQDPFSSLNPRMTLFDIIGEPLLVNGVKNRQERIDRVAELLELAGLPPEFMRRYPHAFSGGQRQRIGIARALALNPNMVIADEPVSALDVSVQAQILNLMIDLQDELGLTYLFVAHDLSVVKHISDRVAVMYVGKIVELGDTVSLYENPLHPYTESLLSSVPKPDPHLRSQRIVLQGEVADPSDPPSGCYFHPRCQYAKDVCSAEAPELKEVQPGHYVNCHFAPDLSLRGIHDLPKMESIDATKVTNGQP